MANLDWETLQQDLAVVVDALHISAVVDAAETILLHLLNLGITQELAVVVDIQTTKSDMMES